MDPLIKSQLLAFETHAHDSMIKPNCRAHYAIGKPRTVLPQMLPRNELKRSGDYFCSDPLYYWLTESDVRSMRKRQGHQDRRLRRVGSRRPKTRA